MDLFPRIRISGPGWTVIAAVCLVVVAAVALHLPIEDHRAPAVTGANSYAYLVALIGPHPPFILAVRVVGGYPVNNVTANMQQFSGADPETRQLPTGSMHGVALGGNWFGPGITLTKEFIHEPGRYVVRIVWKDGDISEQIDIRQCSDGSWSQAIKMNGAGAVQNEKLKGRADCNKPFD